MATVGPENRSRQGQAEPEFTTRPRRLLMIGRMDPGHEQEILEAQLHFPIEVAAEAGIETIEAFVGSGHYALLLEIDGDDTQAAFARYLNDPRIRQFHASLLPLVEGLPGPDWRYVTPGPFRQRDDSGVADGPAYSSANLPLAASVYRWGRGS